MKFCLRALLVCLLIVGFVPSPADASEVGSDVLSARSRAALEQFVADSGEKRRVEFEETRKPTPLDVPDGNVTFDVSLPSGIRYGSMTPVHVTAVIDGKPYRTRICYYRVHVFDKVVVAAASLFQGREIQAADVKLEEQDVTELGDRYFTKVEDAVGKTVTQYIKPGTVLDRMRVKKPYIVLPRSPVKIVTDVNGVRIETDGTAIQRGAEGDLIKVRNNSSGKVVRARVLDATTVKIE